MVVVGRVIVLLMAIFLLVAMPGCSKSLNDGAFAPLKWFYDADVDTWSRPWSPRVIPPDIPEHRITEDCNDNGIDDTFDRAGYIPRGPYATGEAPTYLASATARVGSSSSMHEITVFSDNIFEASVSILKPDWTHRLNPIASLEGLVAPNGSDLHLLDLDSDGLRDIVISHDAPIEVPERHDPNHYLTVLHRLIAIVDEPEDFRIETLPLAEGAEELKNSPIHALEVDESEGATVIAASGYKGLAGHLSEYGAVTRFLEGDLGDPNQHNFSADQYLHSSVLADFDDDGDADYCVASSRLRRLLCLPGPIDDAAFAARGKYRYEDLLPSNVSSDSHAQLIATSIEDDPGGDDAGPDLVVTTSTGIAIIHNQNHRDFGYCESVDPGEEMFDSEGYCKTLINRMFEDPQLIDLGGAVKQVASADLDNDGDHDLVATLPESNEVVLLWNRGGSFHWPRSDRPRATRLPVSGGPWGVIVDDIDNDGRIEIVVSNKAANNLWVLHQRAHPLPMEAECPPSLSPPARPAVPG